MPVGTPHPTIKNPVVGNLNKPLAAGVNTISIYNTAAFNNPNYSLLLIGAIGTALAEVVPFNNSISDPNSISLTASTKNPHNEGDTVMIVPANQVKIWRNTTYPSGSFSLLTTIPMTYDQTQTNFFDPNGQTSYGYYTQYYNSVTSWLSAASPILTGSGYDPTSKWNYRRRIRFMLHDYGPRYDYQDEAINGYIDDVYIQSQRDSIEVDSSYGTKTSFTYTYDGTDSTQEQLLPPDCYKPLYFRANSGGAAQYYTVEPSTYEEVNDVRYDGATATSQGIALWWYPNGQNIGIWPEIVGTGILDYIQVPKGFSGDSAVPLTPLNAYPDELYLQMVAKVYINGAREDLERLQFHTEQAANSQIRVKSALAERQKQLAQTIRTSDKAMYGSSEQDWADQDLNVI